ncbi:hypothetical protein MN116_001411 [Schistosoma mekongi]|uniref:Uncharacterized protein n=1 Tax=Schistosoma mekongi TaxID=38744 RepID=A0AAE2D982_SCHME|nr:hypothetical protein MN116_001411 [Schistosoma mekongi]
MSWFSFLLSVKYPHFEMQNKSSEDVTTKNVSVWKSHKRRRKAKRSGDVVQCLPENVLKTPDEPHICSTKRIIFDEDGETQNLYAADNWEELSNCNRRAKKRSGYVTFTDIYSEQRFTSSERPSSDLKNSGFNTIPDAVPKFLLEIPVKHEKEQHLEVAIYSFPNNYETVVKYWYGTFQTLHLLPSSSEDQASCYIPELNLTENVDSYRSEAEKTPSIAADSSPSSTSLHEDQAGSCM